jgi:hypothetical protein
MSKVNQRRIDLVFKRKRDEANEVEEDRSVLADHPLPLLMFFFSLASPRFLL